MRLGDCRCEMPHTVARSTAKRSRSTPAHAQSDCSSDVCVFRIEVCAQGPRPCASAVRCQAAVLLEAADLGFGGAGHRKLRRPQHTVRTSPGLHRPATCQVSAEAASERSAWVPGRPRAHLGTTSCKAAAYAGSTQHLRLLCCAVLCSVPFSTARSTRSAKVQQGLRSC